MLLKIVLMQFKTSFDLSTKLLEFYTPARGGGGYLESLNRWDKFEGFGNKANWFLNYLGRGVKIAVIIEDQEQIAELDELLVSPDAIVLAGEPIPKAIDYCIALKKGDHLRSPSILMLKQAIRGAATRPQVIYTDHDYQTVDSDTQLSLIHI